MNAREQDQKLRDKYLEDSHHLLEESDRGCVLAGAALLEERLEEIFASQFTKTKIPKKTREAIFNANGPLSTFSAKIKMAYGIGYIDKDLFQDLEMLRKIRNKLAHSSQLIDFLEDANVRNQIESLRYAKLFESKLPGGTAKPGTEVTNDETILRLHGYVKKHKALFMLCVLAMEIELISARKAIEQG